MDRYKWYASNSVMMDNIALREHSDLSNCCNNLPQESFIEDAFNQFSPQNIGINSLLFVYLRENKISNREYAFYEVIFSIDGKLLEIKDMNPANNIESFYVVEFGSDRKLNIPVYNQAMEFILEKIIMKDLCKIRAKIEEHKSIAFLQVDFDDDIISTNDVIIKLRNLFDLHFTSRLGPM